MPAVARPGPASGRITVRNPRNGPHPSTSAASSSSRGIWAKKLRSSHSVKGWFTATRATISIVSVS